MAFMSDLLVEVDSRGRLSLGRLGVKSGYFLAHLETDGRIVLEPMVPMSEVERRLREQRPEIFDGVKKATVRRKVTKD